MGDLKDIHQNIKLLFRSMNRLEKFKEIEAPRVVTENESRMAEDRKRDLRSLGFDVDSYLSSDRGKTSYLLFSVQMDQEEKLNNRCGQCAFYFMKSYPDRDKKFGCMKFEKRPMHCEDLRDTGEDLLNRIHTALERCMMCEFFSDSEDPYCTKGQNELSEECPDLKIKED